MNTIGSHRWAGSTPRSTPISAALSRSTGKGQRRSASTWVSIRPSGGRSEEHTSELQSRLHLVCRLLLEKKHHALKRRSGAVRVTLDETALATGQRAEGLLALDEALETLAGCDRLSGEIREMRYFGGPTV